MMDEREIDGGLTEAIFPDSLRLTALLPIVIAIVARVWPSP